MKSVYGEDGSTQERKRSLESVPELKAGVLGPFFYQSFAPLADLALILGADLLNCCPDRIQLTDDVAQHLIV